MKHAAIWLVASTSWLAAQTEDAAGRAERRLLLLRHRMLIKKPSRLQTGQERGRELQFQLRQ